MDRHRGQAEVLGIAAALEEDILCGRIGPGARLIEDELIERFSTKRYFVREAIRRLETLGIVTRSPNRGASVRTFTREEMEEIYVMRVILTREAASRIKVPADAALIAKLEHIHSDYVQSIARGSFLDINRLNNQFHSEVFAACGNKHLSGMVDHYAWLTQAFRAISISVPELLQNAQRDHEAIIDAMRLGDSRALVRICVEHLQPAKETFFRARGWA